MIICCQQANISKDNNCSVLNQLFVVKRYKNNSIENDQCF